MKKQIILLLSILVLTTSCDDKTQGNSLKGDEDGSVSSNWILNMMIPAYKEYQLKAQKLTLSAKAFQNKKDEASLNTLRTDWEEAYKSFQKTIIFDFDESEVTYYVLMSNTFPADIQLIEDNIIKVSNKEEINLNDTQLPSRLRYQGFPALDYLLFSTGKDLIYYQSNDAAREYIVRLTQTLQNKIDRLVSYWDSHAEKYIKEANQSSDGPYSSIINSFIRVYEKQIRADKVGYAAGAIKDQKGVAKPERIEAYYKGDISKELLKIALQSSQDFFNGKHFDGKGEGKSLKQVLDELGEKDLSEKINKQYTKIYNEIDAIPNSLKETALNDNATMKKLYKEIQGNVGNYKSRMARALNVQIGYQDTDGD